MKIRPSLKPILVIACCVVCASMVSAKPRGGNTSQGMRNSSFGHSRAFGPRAGSANSSFGRTDAEKRKRHASSHGNSAFGHRQRSASTRRKGSRNNAYGQRTAARHRLHSTKDTSANGKTKNTQPGNSAFGHRQGDAATRTTGSQNNAYGKSQSTAAHEKHTSANDDVSASPPAPSPGE
jgi:hypothetical protein